MPKVFGIILIILVIGAIFQALWRDKEIDNLGTFAIARMGSFERGFRGKYILHFELIVNGQAVELEGFEDLPNRSLADSFQKYGLPILYSAKDYNKFVLLVKCESFLKYKVNIPEKFAFLNCK